MLRATLVTTTLALAASLNAAENEWWSFAPLQKPVIPQPKDPGRWVRTPIDAFLTTKLAEQQLTFSPDADPRVLVRRLYFDLTGLPPAPEEVAQFAKQPSEDAYRALVDRLLDDMEGKAEAGQEQAA